MTNGYRSFDDFSNEELAEAFSNPKKSIDITNLKQETLDRLPSTIKAKLVYDGDTPLTLNTVEYLFNELLASEAPLVSLPKLIHGKEITAYRAHVQAPVLLSCDTLHALTLETSKSSHIDALSLYGAGTIDLKGVRKIDKIFCLNARAVYLRNTESLGAAEIPNASVLTAPNLQSLTGNISTRAGSRLTLGISDEFLRTLHPSQQTPMGTKVVIIEPEPNALTPV